MSARGPTVDYSPSQNASSEAETTASGLDTHGTLNQHPGASNKAASGQESPAAQATQPHSSQPFRVGVSEDRNRRWRRTMEDAHAFVYGFGGVHGQGFFSVFDGHAGKNAAEWCGKHFHEYLLKSLLSEPGLPVPDLLNKTFLDVDKSLSELATSSGSSSGCTAVTVFLRLEDEHGKPAAHQVTGGVDPKAGPGQISSGGAAAQESGSSGGLFSGWRRKKGDTSPPEATEHALGKDSKAAEVAEVAQEKDSLVRLGQEGVRRVLYTANVGDARAVLCRKGLAVRLTYDHKGSDTQEAKRITDAGGFVMNNRVNGVLAVTRSLGDSAMKEFVVGSPYTTETALTADDDFLIIACDGLWDVTDDQDAVDLIADITDPQAASDKLLQHALDNFSTDNTSVMVVRFDWTSR